ncbi:MAG: hypothetical protein ACYC4R_03840 [Anaerolineae bacterium]
MRIVTCDRRLAGLGLALLLVLVGCRGPVTATPVPEVQRTPIEVPTERVGAPTLATATVETDTPAAATAVATLETATPEETMPVATETLEPTSDATTTVDSAEVESAVLAAHADAVGNGAEATVQSATALTWPDGCLGFSQPDQVCTQVITPGFRVVLQSDGRLYQYHTNEDGSVVMPVPGPVPADGGLALTWEEGDACTAAVVAPQEGLSYGPCDAPSRTVPITDTTLLRELARFASRYAPVYAETEAGTLYLAGRGTASLPVDARDALVEQIRGLLDAGLTQGEEAITASGTVLTWRREAAEGGACQELHVFTDGAVQAVDCSEGQGTVLGSGQLTAFELQRLLIWRTTYGSFDVVQAPEDKDAATIRLVFTGTGASTPSEGDLRLMANLGQRVLGRLVDW